jgi:hypothetical protein
MTPLFYSAYNPFCTLCVLWGWASNRIVSQHLSVQACAFESRKGDFTNKMNIYCSQIGQTKKRKQKQKKKRRRKRHKKQKQRKVNPTKSQINNTKCFNDQ